MRCRARDDLAVETHPSW